MKELIEIAIICLGMLFGLTYFILISMYCYGWIKTPKSKINALEKFPVVSIIVAARNEEASILNCLQAILKQNYPKTFYEVIVIDDHSTDATFKLVSSFTEQNKNVKIIQLNSDQTGKKNAIEFGIQSAVGEIIVTTDADCVMGEKWLTTMVACLVQSDNKMVVGPVDYHDEKTMLEKFQNLELVALIASGAASLYYKKAIMCNGANLMYYKKTFYDVGGYEGVKSIASGDDVLLMYKIDKNFPKQISFAKNKDAIVYTKAKTSLKEFFHQRKRWASKGFSVLNNETKIVATIVLGFNAISLFMILISALCFIGFSISPYFIGCSFILILIKWFIDFLLLFLTTIFFNKRSLLIYFLPEQLFYSFYLIIVGFFGSFGKYEWKERKIKV